MINFVCALLKDFKITASVLPSMRHFDPISKRIMISTKWLSIKEKNYNCLAAGDDARERNVGVARIVPICFNWIDSKMVYKSLTILLY